jgi:polyphosphate kinase
MIRALYRAAQAGVPIRLNVRGVCCLRPGVPGLSDNIRVFSIIGRFLEHSRVFRFANGGEPEYYIGSADWMRRNLDRRVETAMPITDIALQRELDEILEIYRNDDCSAWDSDSEGVYTRRMPTAGKRHHAAQDELVELAEKSRAALRPVKVIAQPTIDLPTAVGTNDAHIEKDGRRDESGAPDAPAARQSRRETH